MIHTLNTMGHATLTTVSRYNTGSSEGLDMQSEFHCNISTQICMFHPFLPVLNVLTWGVYAWDMGPAQTAEGWSKGNSGSAG